MKIEVEELIQFTFVFYLARTLAKLSNCRTDEAHYKVPKKFQDDITIFLSNLAVEFGIPDAFFKDVEEKFANDAEIWGSVRYSPPADYPPAVYIRVFDAKRRGRCKNQIKKMKLYQWGYTGTYFIFLLFFFYSYQWGNTGMNI